MSEQSHSCNPKKEVRERNSFLLYGALAIALAVWFGYAMAGIQHQETFAEIAKTAERERASLHNRYMRQLGKKDKEISALILACRSGGLDK